VQLRHEIRVFDSPAKRDRERFSRINQNIPVPPSILIVVVLRLSPQSGLYQFNLERGSPRRCSSDHKSGLSHPS
jgi:hypothetical protein